MDSIHAVLLQLQKTQERQGQVCRLGCPSKSQCPGLKLQEKEAQVGVLINVVVKSVGCVQPFLTP